MSDPSKPSYNPAASQNWDDLSVPATGLPEPTSNMPDDDPIIVPPAPLAPKRVQFPTHW
jgi:hypothetical protein